jgi:osmotically-inducible protein OsmY
MKNIMRTNEELRADVMEEIEWNPELKNVATQIGVACKDGVITLTGAVDSYRKKISAEETAQKVSGVKVVASEIEVKIQGMGKQTDTDIAEAVKNALRWNSAVAHDQVEVKVDKAWVYLSGNVDWQYQKESAQQSVENLVGVAGVVNSISLKSRSIDTNDIKVKIAAAFHRSASVDSSAIQIETVGPKVILYGKVSSWAEKKEAEKIAWLSPGVVTVENQIEVDTTVFA